MINFAARMKQVAYIIIVLCVFLACGGNRQQEDTLMRARAVMNEHPDSAIAILDSLYCNEAEMDNHFRMQVLLHRTEAQNKLFTRFPSDSILKELVDYFDHHGTRNERMLAHYLLGCVLSDLGNSPEALQAFYDAIERADTTCALRSAHAAGSLWPDGDALPPAEPATRRAQGQRQENRDYD